MNKVKTEYHENFIDSEIASSLYSFLAENIAWEDGIFSKKHNKVSRSAYSVNLENPTFIDTEILNIVSFVGGNIESLEGKVNVGDIYVNFYKDGQDCAPSHSHPGMKQLIISLGATRTLQVGAKNFSMKNGDVIIFGSSTHQVPIEPQVKNGRISIAVFIPLT